jgi:(p)ppGpp synthase/HD superfamily hydrolase
VLDSQEILAKRVAEKYHAGQVDKGGNPYISHPAAVASSVSTDEEKAVAWLHDVLEDTSCSLEELKAFGFSDSVLDAVVVLTRDKDEDYFDYIKRLQKNRLARVVKIADLKNNCDLTRIKNPGEADYKRIEKYKAALKMLKA